MTNRDSSAARSGFFTRYLSRLRFPWLFTLLLGLLGIDLVVPDFVPFVDEVLLAVTTLLLGTWKRRKQSPPERSVADQPNGS